MNTLTLHPDRRRSRRQRRHSPEFNSPAVLPALSPALSDETALDCDELTAEPNTIASQSYLEPEGEGILFAAFCLVSSLLIYCGVMLIHFLG